MLALLRKRFPDLKDIPVTVLGLSFKSGTDDLRESCAIPLIAGLTKAGACVRAYDPVAMPSARRSGAFPKLQYCRSLEHAVKGARALLLVTAWPDFERIPQILARLRSPPVVIDGRRQLSPASVQHYEGIGYSQHL